MAPAELDGSGALIRKSSWVEDRDTFIVAARGGDAFTT